MEVQPDQAYWRLVLGRELETLLCRADHAPAAAEAAKETAASCAAAVATAAAASRGAIQRQRIALLKSLPADLLAPVFTSTQDRGAAGCGRLRRTQAQPDAAGGPAPPFAHAKLYASAERKAAWAIRGFSEAYASLHPGNKPLEINWCDRPALSAAAETCAAPLISMEC